MGVAVAGTSQGVMGRSDGSYEAAGDLSGDDWRRQLRVRTADKFACRGCASDGLNQHLLNERLQENASMQNATRG